MIIKIIDSTGRSIGTIKDHSVFNLAGKKIFEAKPKTTLKEIIKMLKISLMLDQAEVDQ